jgi:beta-lactam-binding protein with PASTA domain
MLVVLLVLSGAGLAWAGSASWVVVPRATGGSDLIHAYRRVHAAGLRVAVTQTFSLQSLCLPIAGAQTPAAGTRVAAGATVALRRLGCVVASGAGGGAPVIVASLVGRSARAAVALVERAGLYWEIDRIPSLRPSRRAELLDNYVVTAQSPAAGAFLGRGVDCSTYAARCFRPTPVVLRVRRL